MNTTIGIIGGMGPQAGLKLQQKILQKAIDGGAVNGEDFPKIISVSLPVKDFMGNTKAKAAATEAILDAVDLLDSQAVTQTIIACNTAHLAIDEDKISGLVSMPKSAVCSAAQRGMRKVGLIASPTTLKAKLYEGHAKIQGIDIVPISSDDMEVCEQIIRRVIAGISNKADVSSLSQMIDSLQLQGVDGVILGCTELSIVGKELVSGVVIDSLDSVVGEVNVNNNDSLKEKI